MPRQARFRAEGERRHPVFRVRAAGQERSAARLDHREARREPDHRGRRRQGHHHGPARAADPGVFRHPGRPSLFVGDPGEAFQEDCGSRTSPSPRRTSGGIKMARAYAKRLEADLIVIDKRRPRQNEAEVMNIIGEAGEEHPDCGRPVDTAGTLCNAVKALKNAGAKDVYAACTHPVLSGSAIETDQRSPRSRDRRDGHPAAADTLPEDCDENPSPGYSRKPSSERSTTSRSARCSMSTKGNITHLKER